MDNLNKKKKRFSFKKVNYKNVIFEILNRKWILSFLADF